MPERREQPRDEDPEYNEGSYQRHYDEPWWDPLGGGNTGPQGSGSQGSSGTPSEFDEQMAGVPLLGWLTGASDRVNRNRDEREADRNRDYWRDLAAGSPTLEQLTPETYEEGSADVYGDLLGEGSELEGYGPTGDQRTALDAMRTMYESGGWSDRDAQVAGDLRRLSAMERGQQLRGANEAALQQMGARGMGGGGAELGARLSASQSMNQGQAMSDAATNAALQQAAMQRALQAMQGYGSMSNTVQQQELARRQALDNFNNNNMDWRRGRETRNTAWANQGSRDRADAFQQTYQNRERATAGMTNQYSTDAAQRNARSREEDERDQGLLAGLGEILDI